MRPWEKQFIHATAHEILLHTAQTSGFLSEALPLFPGEPHNALLILLLSHAHAAPPHQKIHPLVRLSPRLRPARSKHEVGMRQHETVALGYGYQPIRNSSKVQHHQLLLLQGNHQDLCLLNPTGVPEVRFPESCPLTFQEQTSRSPTRDAVCCQLGLAKEKHPHQQPHHCLSLPPQPEHSSRATCLILAASRQI